MDQFQQNFSHSYGNPLSSRVNSFWIVAVGILAAASFVLLVYLTVFPILNLRNFNLEIESARTAWQNNQHTEIIAHSEEALKLASNDTQEASARYWLGIGYYRQDNLDKAEENEKTAIKLQPDFVGPYVTLGAIMHSRRNLQEARGLAEKAIELDPKYAWGYNLLGIVLADEGKREEAVTQFKKAIELDSQQTIFQQNLQRVEQSFNQ